MQSSAALVRETHPGFEVTAFPVSAWASIAPVWTELAQASRCSIFLTAEWIEAWLETFGPGCDLTTLLVKCGDETVGACLLVRNRPSLFSTKRIWLNASGEPSKDTTYVEYNDLLARTGYETAVAEAIGAYLGNYPWDELMLTGFQENSSYEILTDSFPKLDRDEMRHPAHYVDLAAIRKADTTYLNYLGGKTARRLRQNLRYYAEVGPLAVEIADNLPRALEMLEEIGDLSRIRWADLGQRSIFCSSRFTAFHRSVITKCFALGWIQMIRVAAGGKTVGIVYNFVHRGKVYFYQCGYSYPKEKRLSPGRATLSLAIQHCLEAGYDDFDFLSGQLEYKASLSTGSRRMIWASVRRRGVKSPILEAIRRIMAE